MRTKGGGFQNKDTVSVNFRELAAHHAIGMHGLKGEHWPEGQRILKLAINEAEALACETGVPELVLLTLAEEKVRTAREWFARQHVVKKRSPEWQIAA